MDISLDAEPGDAVRPGAAPAGKPLPSWLAETVASKLRAEARTEFLTDWQAARRPDS